VALERDDSLGYSSENGYVQLPKQTLNPRPSTTDHWSTSAVAQNPAPPTAKPDSSIPESMVPPWVSPFPDHFVAPWSDDKSLGSGYIGRIRRNRTRAQGHRLGKSTSPRWSIHHHHRRSLGRGRSLEMGWIMSCNRGRVDRSRASLGRAGPVVER
jgi:hypothetical protein